VLTCKTCGVTIDVTVTACPSCGAEVPLGRLTGMLGLVCRECDAYNDPGARACAGCGKPLVASAPASPARAPSPAAPARPPPATAAAPTRSAARTRLVVERGEAPPGAFFDVRQGDAQAGRAQGQLLFPEDPCLAPLHATFTLRDGELHVRDEGAAGGVFLRLRGLTVPLRPGHFFAVGDRLLRYGGALPPPDAPAADGTRRLGAARPEGRAVVIEEWLEGGVGGRSWLRSGPSITFGRSGCAVNLGDDPHLSQAHAELLLDGEGQARLRDLGSTTGTFLRIPPGTERELHDGDAVRLGREVLRVEVGPAEQGRRG
jgi:FHA domain-containing protein